MASCEAATEAVWLRGLLSNLGASQGAPTTIWEDNQGAIKLSKDDCLHSQTKHIAARHHFVRERSESGEVRLDKMATEEMPADMLTKSLAGMRVAKLSASIGLHRRAEVL